MSPDPGWPVIHYSKVIPIVKTLCGLTFAPASPDTNIVSCPKCRELLGLPPKE